MKTLKVLSIGNSFSCDTMEHMADVALSLGYENVRIGNLYVGGCSIRRHFAHAQQDAPVYEYYENVGNGWEITPEYSISRALSLDQWDWVSIQHGTADGSKYTEGEYYELLPSLCKYVRSNVEAKTKVAFNMTWVGEMDFDHPEIQSYNGDQLKMYNAITNITQSYVCPLVLIDRVSPTGTAIQNARSAEIGLLTRDGYHLSLGLGRYIATLTFVAALTGDDISQVKWVPSGVTEYEKLVAIESASNALKTPFSITESKVVKRY